MSDAADPLVFLVAGEPSGDVLGAKLIAALRAATGGRVRVAGVGGERMAAEGLESLFALEDIAVMGITEIVPRVPVIFERLRRVKAAIRKLRPAVVVTIDAPAFCIRVAEATKAAGIPEIHYVGPQYWAWRPWRVKRFARAIDHLMVLLPFEKAFFEKAGIACTYVGHPATEAAPPTEDRSGFRQRHNIAADAPLLAVLPGSRRGLVARMLPVYAQAIAALRRTRPDLHLLFPVVGGTAAMVRDAAQRWSVPATIVNAPDDKRAGLAAADAALTISGTATLELAVAGLPMVVTYQASALSAFLARRLINVPYVALPNLILGREVVPELLQENGTPEKLAAALAPLLAATPARATQLQGLAAARAALSVAGTPPSARAAQVVLDIMKARSAA
jgi:lipid-A-disaccharide synthase